MHFPFVLRNLGRTRFIYLALVVLCYSPFCLPFQTIAHKKVWSKPYSLCMREQKVKEQTIGGVGRAEMMAGFGEAGSADKGKRGGGSTKKSTITSFSPSMLKRFEELKAAGNTHAKVFARVRSDGNTPAGNWYECGEVAAADGQSIETAVWQARHYILEYSTWQFPGLLLPHKKQLLEVILAKFQAMNNTNRSTSICPPSRLHMHTRTHHAHQHMPPQMLSQPGLLAQGNDILAVSKPQHTNTQHDIAFYPWGGALKKTNPRMTKG